jgi:hypothetical protein
MYFHSQAFPQRLAQTENEQSLFEEAIFAVDVVLARIPIALSGWCVAAMIPFKTATVSATNLIPSAIGDLLGLFAKTSVLLLAYCITKFLDSCCGTTQPTELSHFVISTSVVEFALATIIFSFLIPVSCGQSLTATLWKAIKKWRFLYVPVFFAMLLLVARLSFVYVQLASPEDRKESLSWASWYITKSFCIEWIVVGFLVINREPVFKTGVFFSLFAKVFLCVYIMSGLSDFTFSFNTDSYHLVTCIADSLTYAVLIFVAPALSKPA